jgi:hypothetical protein
MSDDIIYYLKLSANDVDQLNQIMWDSYVFKNNEYLVPFEDGTLNYYDTTDELQLVTPLLENAVNDLNIPQFQRDFIAQALLTKKTREELVAMGAIQPIPPAPPQGI